MEADPEMIEERKWKKPSNAMMGVPVWSHDGIVCTGETYKKAVKLTFAQGANVPDPSRLFNSSLEGNTRQGDRHPGRREGRRARVQGAREGRGGEEWLVGEETVEPCRRTQGAKRREGRRRPALGRQPADREGGRRRPGAGVHRRDAGLEARRREAPRRAHRPERAQRAQGREVELAVLRHRGPRVGSCRSTSSPTTSR